MAAKRRAHRSSPGDSKELGRNGGNEGSDEVEDSGKSGETPISAEPKEMPLKQVEQPSPPSPKDAGAQASGEASPARSALKTKKTTFKRTKKAPPASQEEDEAEDSADASPARDPVPDDTADACHNRRAANAKQGEKRSLPPQQEEEPPEKRAAGPDGETEKKPAVERSWSYDDELKILSALAVHVKSHDGALPEPLHLLANLTFDKIDANEEKLNDKIRKLRMRYHRLLTQGCPSDGLGRRLFKLSEIVWGQVDEDERVEPTSRDFSVLSKLYPHLAKEVKAYADTHVSEDLVMTMFMTIGDEKACDLDAKCKKQQIEAFKLELGQASLTNELLSALSGETEEYGVRLYFVEPLHTL